MWQSRRHVSFFSQTREPGHSSPMPVLLLCGAGAACGGAAAGLGGLAGGTTACDGGALRCCAGATCGVTALSGAGSTAQVAEPLAMAAHYAGRSSDSALCNLPRAADRSLAKACWPEAVAAFAV